MLIGLHRAEANASGPREIAVIGIKPPSVQVD
jgi:hypothetical protein